MLPLLNAIYSLFTSTGSLTTAFPGGLHRDRAPEGTAMPYVVSRVVSSKTEPAYSSGSRSTTQIKFNVYAVGHDAAAALAQTLTAAFDGVLLTLTSGTHDSTVRPGDPTPTLHSQDGQGNDVWEWAVAYEYGVSA